ncbi:Latrophilin Cirl [Portunus trituberculatus]|uniref:Latrophilin Cirl n=1 Tax=Portunus trituberculatus TaxID=210409 RepID=A0A5B7DEB9_PORTR|nr:Latrophilin Cirl [Portunus trituberculatus]
MDCDPGHVINLIRANYGRFSITICNEHGNTEWSVNCMSPRSHRVLHDNVFYFYFAQFIVKSCIPCSENSRDGWRVKRATPDQTKPDLQEGTSTLAPLFISSMLTF